ncbi:hypothetical protein, partial [Leptospira gomenensis]|uniref:hypothetical protein n=1 Tax=Leptospira gomenensis TaxID=2484974 RepID=UPI001AEF6C9F
KEGSGVLGHATFSVFNNIPSKARFHRAFLLPTIILILILILILLLVSRARALFLRSVCGLSK